ncbi:MAG: SrfA family protein [Reyranella sp.]|uniref:SrfA family protein n=1 Tax=Reyranella sp. TaxID=1929291 RepID=UPI003D121EF9
MAAGPLLVSEPLQRYRALGMAGDPVWRAAGQLRTAVTARLSRRHADLLAIPEVDPTGRQIDWYAPFEGTVHGLADLSEAERTAVLDEVRRLHDDMSSLAESMEAPSRSGAERNFARLLRHALTAPGEDTLYVVDGKPVMTFWGFSADAALPGSFLASPPVSAAPRPGLAQPAPQAVLASAPAVAAVGARSTWWQWLLLAVLLLLLLALAAWLVRPYLPRLEPVLEAEARERALGMSVRQPVELQKARVDTLQRDSEALRLELARLTDELARRGGDCAAGLVVPGGVIVGNVPIERGAAPDSTVGPDVAAVDKGTAVDKGPGAGNEADKDRGKDQGQKDQGPGGPDERNLDKNADNRNADRGSANNNRMDDKNKGAVAPKDEPKPMVVPPDARQKQDLAFLKGDWRSRTGLATATGERDIRPTYTLDDKGKGKVSFRQKNGSVCEAPAEARWSGDKLTIEEKANPKCADGRTYARNTVNCEVGADGVAKCSGSQPGDSRSYRVQIGR